MAKKKSKFAKFSEVCRYSGLGTDGMGGFEPVCHKPDRRPPGKSWEKCREEYCPFFGVEISGSEVMMFGSDGKLLMTAEECTIHGIKSSG